MNIEDDEVMRYNGKRGIKPTIGSLMGYQECYYNTGNVNNSLGLDGINTIKQVGSLTSGDIAPQIPLSPANPDGKLPNIFQRYDYYVESD